MHWLRRGVKGGLNLPPYPYLALGRGCIFALHIYHHLLIYYDISGGFGDLFSSVSVLVPLGQLELGCLLSMCWGWGYHSYQCLATCSILQLSERTAFLVTFTSFRKVGKITLIFSKTNAVCLQNFL